MSDTATLNVRMDAETKRDFSAFCDKIGMSASSLMNVFARTVVRNQEVPFPVTTKAIPEISARYRAIFPNSEEEVFEAIDAGAATPVEECTPMEEAQAEISERMEW